MKLAFLAKWASIHTVRWVNEFAHQGHEVHLLTAHRTGERLDSSVKIHILPFRPPLGYYLNVPFVRKRLRAIVPNLLNVHYASGYGTLGRLSEFHPLVLSVWGSDVYDYPYKSRSNLKRVVKNLRAADWICSTSEAMACQARKLAPEIVNMSITPFGVDPNIFRPATGGEDSSLTDPECITIGTVKALAPKYGTDVMIRAVKEVVARLKSEPVAKEPRLRLLIVGDGPQRKEMEDLVDETGLRTITEFTGHVVHQEVPRYLNQLDIYVAASRSDSESFGVAVLEASACGVPVVVSNVGGLPEVVENGRTGFVVERENPHAVADVILKLVRDPSLRSSMGRAGRDFVMRRYSWAQSARIMEQVYRHVIERSTNRVVEVPKCGIL